ADTAPPTNGQQRRAFVSGTHQGSGRRLLATDSRRPRGAETMENFNQDSQSYQSDLSARLAASLERAKKDFDREGRQALAQRPDPDWSDEAVLRYVLRGPSLKVSSLFRHCTASLRGDTNTAAQYLDDAAYEYLVAPEAYEAAWQGYLTEEVR